MPKNGLWRSKNGLWRPTNGLWRSKIGLWRSKFDFFGQQIFFSMTSQGLREVCGGQTA